MRAQNLLRCPLHLHFELCSGLKTIVRTKGLYIRAHTNTFDLTHLETLDIRETIFKTCIDVLPVQQHLLQCP